MAQSQRDVEQVNLDIEPPAQPAEAPLCGIHQTPMTWQKGRRGPFWSCHKKNEDGGWCTFRPRERTSA
jgi:hypothetical protein